MDARKQKHEFFRGRSVEDSTDWIGIEEWWSRHRSGFSDGKLENILRLTSSFAGRLRSPYRNSESTVCRFRRFEMRFNAVFLSSC